MINVLQVAPLHLFWITLDDDDDHTAGSPAHLCVTSRSRTSGSRSTINTFRSMAELQLVDEDETYRVPVRQSAIGTTLVQALFHFNWIEMFCKVVDP
jgi:hypothetical protein